MILKCEFIMDVDLILHKEVILTKISVRAKIWYRSELEGRIFVFEVTDPKYYDELYYYKPIIIT